VRAKTKLNNIQVLRAFAASVVILFHTGFAFPRLHAFGSFGVDIFFVISGYIMARILDPRSSASSDAFLRRRILRIVPPYWFFTMCLFCLACVAPQWMEATQVMHGTRGDGMELLKSLLFVPYLKRSGYIQPLLGPGWTLNFEMFFYLCLAIGLLVNRRYAAWIGSAFVLITVAGMQPFLRESMVAKFYANYIGLEFIFGVVCYTLCNAVAEKSAQRFRLPALVVCIVCMAALIFQQGIWPDTELYRAMSYGIPAFLMVGSASFLSLGGWDISLSGPVLVGDASYILYLVHPFCELFIVRALGRHFSWLRNATPLGALATITLAIAVSIAIHVYCERPLVRLFYRQFGGKRKKPEPVLVTA
jgi:peptidoglycan/LPS O-acetylase OafA/YrhL